MTLHPPPTRRVGRRLEQLAANDRPAAVALMLPTTAPPRRPPPPDRPTAAQVRHWAHKQSIPCPRSGPIPDHIRAEYNGATRWRQQLVAIGAWLADIAHPDERT